MAGGGWNAEAVLRRKIHERYILFILVSILIGLVTVKWSDVPKLPEYLSFALTLSSLILAALAIGYAIYSNRGMENNLAALVSSIKDVRDIASTLSSSSLSLTSDLRALSERTGGIDKRISEIADRAKESQEQKKQVAPETSLSVEEAPNSSNILERFVTGSSMTGRYVMFALVITFLNKKALNMSEMFKGMPVDAGYCQGFLVACATTEMFEGSSEFNQTVVVAFPGADEALLERLVELNRDAAANAETGLDLPGSVALDWAKMRTYLEKHDFNLFGALDAFALVPDTQQA
jgi:hypothetical protein